MLVLCVRSLKQVLSLNFRVYFLPKVLSSTSSVNNLEINQFLVLTYGIGRGLKLIPPPPGAGYQHGRGDAGREDRYGQVLQSHLIRAGHCQGFLHRLLTFV